MKQKALRLNLPDWSGGEDGKVSWPPFMAGCFPIKSKYKCFLLTEETVTRPKFATLTVYHSSTKGRFQCPLFLLGFGLTSPKPLEKQSPTQRYLLSQWLHTLRRPRAQRGTDTFTACHTDSSLSCSGLWTVFAIANVAEVNKIICLCLWGLFIFRWKMLYMCDHFLD